MEKYDLKGVMFDVFNLPESVKLLERFPQMAIWPEFKEPLRVDRNKAIKYIIAVYDKNGLRLYEQNLPRRKAIAAEMVGWIKSDKGEFREHVKDIMDGKDRTISRMIVRYCKMHKAPRYAALVGMEETYYKILDKMVSDEELKPSDIATFQKFEAEIESRASELLNGDKSPDMLKRLYEEIELEPLELRPEHVAKRLKEGKKVVDYDPYDGYTVAELRLIIDREEGEAK